MIPVERLFELFDLREDGSICWRKTRGGRAAGTPAGAKNGEGYLVVGIYKKSYFVHRVVFAMFNGRWPNTALVIDHIDGDRLNNRPENLREVSKKENSSSSRKKEKPNKTGHRGVSLHRQSGRYCAKMKIGEKRICIGYFDSAREAATAYVLESLENLGEFSPFWSRTA